VATERTQPPLSAVRLAVATKRARAEAGAATQLLMAEPIAIVGIGCRFPGGAENPAAYWRLLAEGRSGIRQIPEGRWPGALETLEPRLLLGGYLDRIDCFDPEFFGIAPREAHSLDPQQRLLLEVCWEALLDACMPPSSLSGSETGVFAAVYNTDYSRLQMREGAPFDAYTGVGTAHSVAAGRISFLLNLRGPCMVVDTACSSSLVAIHLACQSLRRKECGVALVGGSSLKSLPDEVRVFAGWGMLSHDGQARTFDAGASGFVPGEGCGVVVLKRFSDAIVAGDPIRAVIRGTAINHDGRSSVLTAPNGPAQEAVIRDGLRDAQIRASDVSFIETHGTGTSLGDPIEVEALDAVYGASPDGGNSVCVLGAVKTNLGHLEAAAGIAGLIKVVLSLENQAIPRNLNFDRINPQIRLGIGSRLKLANEPREWPRGTQLRFAAVSSFGISGTNAHVVLEEAPILPGTAELASPERTVREFCLPVSAHSSEALKAQVRTYVTFLRKPGADLAQIARAAARARDHAAIRVAVVATSAVEAAEKLEAKMAGWIARPSNATQSQSKLAFVFSGQGSGWPDMLSALAMEFPQAENVFSTCEAFVRETARWDLRAAARNAAMLEDTAKSQPLLFAMQVALVRTLASWGIVPSLVAGHSAGEVAAAVTAGVLSLEQGLRLILKRGQRMGETSAASEEQGRMLAAEMSIAEANSALSADALSKDGAGPEIAAINGPRSVVFSGAESKMQVLAGILASREVNTRWLDVRYAFHSCAMDKASRALAADLRLEFASAPARSRPSITIVSTVTGKLWEDHDGSAEYWGEGIRRPVLFRQAVDQIFRLGCRTVIEIGPHPALLRAVTDCAGETLEGSAILTIASMRRGQGARGALMSAVALLYEAGAALTWQKIYPGSIAPVELPSYAWNRRRYWLAEESVAQPGRGNELLQQEISTPFVEGQLWQSLLSTKAPSWIAEHRWNEHAIFPFAAWLEEARRVATAAANGDPVTVRDFAVHQPLIVHAEPTPLHTLSTPARELKLAAKVEGNWQTFASGFWEPGESIAGEAKSVFDVDALKDHANEVIAGEQVYRELSENGLSYGPAFRLLERVYVGAGFALGEIAAVTENSPAYVQRQDRSALHPTLLDACLQAVQFAQPHQFRGRAVLPMSVVSYRVLRSAVPAFALVEMTSASLDEAEADVLIIDPQGILVAEIKALRVRRVASSVKRSAIWQTDWQPAAEVTSMPSDKIASTWIIPVGMGCDFALTQWREEIARAVEAQGTSTRSIDPKTLFRTSLHQPASILLAGTLSTLTSQLLQIALQEHDYPGSVKQVCLVTRGAIAVRPGESTDPEQASVWGLARTFRAEYPAIATYLIDLPPASAAAMELASTPVSAAGSREAIAAQEANLVSRWLVAQSASRSGATVASSEEVALRNGRFLRPQMKAAHADADGVIERSLVIGIPGLLETLHEEPFGKTDPAPGEVQIACYAHGLNFRDVLTAMGSYAGQPAPFGGECAGVVLKAADGAGFAPGTPVVAFAPGSLRTTVNVPAAYVAVKPAAMSFAEAAGIPVAFLTAYYAFSRLAQLQPGQTVLVHSAAGGLGQAAVQIAHWYGATVIATAGTTEKRAFLKAQGIAHVFDSRSEHFAEDVLHVTGRRGVDVILNALSGEKIAAGFRALNHGGVFLEVGKRDIWSRERAAQTRPDVRYTAFDLGEVAQDDSTLISAMLQELLAAFAEGKLFPLPCEVYSIAESEDAFRRMAGGRHVGKLVLMRPPRLVAKESWTTALCQGTVLITGGTGALGLATAQWLIEQGAKSIVLVSRRAASDVMKQFQNASSARGVRVIVACADVADRDELAIALQTARSFPETPLRIVFHAAGEVDDRLLATHTAEAFARSMRAKIEGARLLDEMTAADALLKTVYYSSVAASLGSAGQGAYAAANAYLDGLAEQRTARGLSTLSVNWGAWAEGGMIEKLSAASKSRIARQGVQSMSSETALEALGAVLLSGRSGVTIADVQWKSYIEQILSGSPLRAFFLGYLPSGDSDSSRIATRPDLGDARLAQGRAVEEFTAIRAAARAERVPRMEAFVRDSARKVLGLSSEFPMPGETPLQQLGLDSLMALELRNLLAQALGSPLKATLLFDYPTIRGLAQYLLTLVVPDAKEAGRDADGARAGWRPDPADGKGSTEDFDFSAISDAEAEELLVAELDRKEKL
jgi:acyl transferase domain-containing protein/NADPH:quinone reductase-like Zn-dependent oxidoreductase/acyl carrier protein